MFDERDALANLIANLTLDTEENKMILKQLKKANASLTQELENCKTNLDETSRALGEATSCRDSCLIALQNKQTEFEKYKAFNDRTIDYDILQDKFLIKNNDFIKKSLLTSPNWKVSQREYKGVIHTTSVSRPRLKCYQVQDKVVPNNSQVKFKKKTSNENVVCAECGTCVFNSNHDACVSRYLKDVNARPKKHNVVPISASKPKRKANKSVATPHKKIVALDTTIQKSKSYYKELYENTNQEFGELKKMS
ncbi:hypothetical protein Tco_1110781 [Tanacetum coccineum]|uniref:Uncharacterized protein n=1 Tax=Tanacetum coccineum TaxID=301880 RepID=A0ABQ5IJU4_9ASTR